MKKQEMSKLNGLRSKGLMFLSLSLLIIVILSSCKFHIDKCECLKITARATVLEYELGYSTIFNIENTSNDTIKIIKEESYLLIGEIKKSIGNKIINLPPNSNNYFSVNTSLDMKSQLSKPEHLQFELLMEKGGKRHKEKIKILRSDDYKVAPADSFLLE